MQKILNQYINEHFDQLVKDTQGFISINSVLDESNTTPGAPFGEGIRQALTYALNKADEMGFETKNIDGYAGYAQYGHEGDQVAILAHVDVVPAVGDWIVPPYSAEIIDNKLYGRGSVDDKGPAMACLYALKAIKDCKLPIKNHARIILGTDEETLARGIYYYLDREKAPDYGFSPDAEFPIIHAEKGTIRFMYHLPESDSDIVELHAGTRLNVVPDLAVAKIKGISPQEVLACADKLQLKAKINAHAREGQTTIEVHGVSSHACYPENGINAIQNLLLLLKVLYPVHDTPLKQSLFRLTDLLKDETNGASLGIACNDEVSGDLSFNTAIIEVSAKGKKGDVNNRNVIKFDLRYPVTHNGEKLLSTLEKAGDSIGIKYELIQHKPPLYVEKDRPFIKELQKAYKECTGGEPKCISIGGGTYCRYVKNTVSFGPVFPGQIELAHQNNEFIALDDLKEITKIYAQAIYNLIG